MVALIKMGALFRMGALIGRGALIYKNTFEGGAYWKEGAKSNHYGIYITWQGTSFSVCVFFYYYHYYEVYFLLF